MWVPSIGLVQVQNGWSLFTWRKGFVEQMSFKTALKAWKVEGVIDGESEERELRWGDIVLDEVNQIEKTTSYLWQV